ncbi:MAG: hypothetical protein ACTSQ5_13435, partial [Promethearchaeota archaeon]
EDDKIKQLIEMYKNKQVLPPKTETPLHLEIKDDNKLYINDFLILKPTPLETYLQELIQKLTELDLVHDLSQWQGENALKLCSETINENLKNALKKITEISNANPTQDDSKKIMKIYESIIPDLEFLNLFKYNLEIDEAVIKCPKCNRWFPVFETIPQMLPDEVRNSESDRIFKEKWKSKFNF